jgi:hypothetical protein
MTTKYIIEGSISFYDELYKSLDDSDLETDNICQISGEPLSEKSVTMECGHKFNYIPLYKEIYNQKYVFNTYTLENLNNKNKLKFQKEHKQYYIKCPYCRDIQFTILPYYEDLQLAKFYGINSLDFSLPNKRLIHTGYGFNHYGKIFMNIGKPCNHNNCNSLNVANIEGTDLNYCIIHWKEGNKNFKNQQKLEEKQKKIEEKLKILEDKKQKILEEKQKKIEEKLKKFEEKNAERIAKGLKPLVSRKKANVENKIIGEVSIEEYVPEDQNKENTNKKIKIKSPISEELLCKGILSSGPNKGKQCTLRHIDNQQYCFRHIPK